MTLRSMRWMGLLLGLLAFGAGCDGGDDGGDACELSDGTTVEHGDSIMDECNTCTCNDGDLSCTMMACVDSGMDGGDEAACQTEDGMSVPHDGMGMVGCQECVCNDGTWEQCVDTESCGDGGTDDGGQDDAG